MNDTPKRKEVVISKETLVPIGLISVLILGAVRVEKIGWIADIVTVRAVENSVEIKTQGKQIDEVKAQFLTAINEINLKLAEIKGATDGKKEDGNKGRN